MIHFQCPSCSVRLNVADDKAGTKGPCPKCGQRLQVPGLTQNKTILGKSVPGATYSLSEPPPLRRQAHHLTEPPPVRAQAKSIAADQERVETAAIAAHRSNSPLAALPTAQFDNTAEMTPALSRV